MPSKIRIATVLMQLVAASLTMVAICGLCSASGSSRGDNAPIQNQSHRSAANCVQLGVGTLAPAPADASAQQLEAKADELRAEKDYLGAMDYFQAALSRKPRDAQIVNKMGIVELQTSHVQEAKKYFERAIKLDKSQPDPINNLGVVFYEMKMYGKAIRFYRKAIELKPDMASYYSNLGAALFSKKDFDKASTAYATALQLDPQIFERTSRTGVAAQLPSPEDRARYEYIMARLYAKMGLKDESLRCLRRALEQGYKQIDMVYKDPEFSQLRNDPRFIELMSTKVPPVPD